MGNISSKPDCLIIIKKGEFLLAIFAYTFFKKNRRWEILLLMASAVRDRMDFQKVKEFPKG